VCREVGDGAVNVAPALNLLRLMILRCGSALVSGGVVRLVVSSFAKGGMIYLSPWDAFSGPSSLVALDLGWWAMRSEEGGISGVASSSLVRELLMCHSGNRCVMVGAPWRWLLQRFQALELLGGETNFSSLVGAGGRGKEDEGLHCNFCFSGGLLCNLGMYCASFLIPSFLSQKIFLNYLD